MTHLMLHLRRFGIRLTADRKRFAVLCVLCAVGLLLWTRLIVIKRIPRTALAEPEVQVEPAADTALAGDAGPPITVILPDLPSRDPFAIDTTFFPSGEAEASEAGVISSPSQAAADPREAVAAMRLEASMPPSLAVIDGTTRRRGDTVSGSAGLPFTLVEIQARTVVLSRGGDRYVLRME
jgi:hypothetical protein